MDFPDLLDDFLRYVRVDTRSDEESEDFPSTAKQFDLARLLEKELIQLSLDDVRVDRWGYVFATLKTNQTEPQPTIALIAHLDTSPDVSGENVNPQVWKDYDGRDLILPRGDNVVLRTADDGYLGEKIGATLITSDGATLLGADDKAGIAEIINAVKYLNAHPEIPRPHVRLVFTPDEEVGRGTEKLNLDEVGADCAYTLDGEKLGEVEDETFCADSVDITVTGVNVHPGYAKGKLINAVKIAADILNRFPADAMSPETTEKREGYVHPHHIEGGVEKTVLKVLVRDFLEDGLKEKEDFIRDIVETAGKRYPGATIDMKVKESYRNMKLVLDQHPETVQKALRAVEMAGVKPRKNIIRGGTDGARLSFMGLPTPNIFTGGTNFHSRKEWITLEDMQKAAEVIVHLMTLWVR